MKKTCVLTLGLFAALSMSAQLNVVKDAEKAFKGADNYAAYQKALEAITPAFSNPETDKQAQTYWIPGKAGFKVYDDMYAKKAIGQDVNLVDMGSALLDGYEYGMKALDVDSVADAKGKIKTKFSKDIVSQIVGHFQDFMTSGSSFWDSHDYAKAYKAWTIYLSIPQNPRFGKSAPDALPDSTVAQFDYYRALSAWQAEMLPEAASAFDQLVKIGYNDPQAYDYAYSVAYQLKDEDRKLAYSQAGLDKFGTSNPVFLQRIVNSYIDAKNYAPAQKMLEEAIAADPNNGAYYLSLGVLYENQGDNEKAAEAYKKAVELDPNNSFANYYYGRMLVMQYDKLDQETGNMSQSEYNKYNYENMRPLLLESIKYFEKAYELDNENTDPLRYLKNIYYNLNDGENLKRVEELLKY
ncbi:MAG: tetratricopeptide repeat protein [Duncaniella sp.]|nr:tetratricopeptide repeat protein [Duncaniella sp.]MDE6859542.1 tetratricopeptide repeat protein [Duncaniella sp.]MDE7145558.1 tetratricopeptide repeat protein [Duncaniella sp.]